MTKVHDFTGITLFVGIDVHKKSWKITLRTSDRYLRTFSQDPKPSVLMTHLRNNYPGASIKCVYEAGFCGFWICRELQKLGASCMVVHVPDVPTSDKNRKQKTDARDSKNLAEQLASGSLSGISIPSYEQECDRGLVRTRQQLVRDRARTKNRIKSVLNRIGIENPYPKWSKAMISWLLSLELHPSSRIELQTHVNQLQSHTDQIKELDKQIKLISQKPRYKRNAELMMGIPSIGVLTAMTFLTEIGDIHRFSSRNHFCSFLGLIPNTHSSGENDNIGRITKRANHRLRVILVECAWIAIRKDPALTLKFDQLSKRMKKQLAIIRIARSLANRIRHLLINQCEYVSGVLA